MKSLDWKRKVLFLAGIYNILWGAVVVLFPGLFFDWANMQKPLYLEIWQCVGMIVGVYGIGYLISFLDPMRHWPIIFVGLLGKVFGPIGFVYALVQGKITIGFGVNIIFNDLIWWMPFTLILLEKYRSYYSEHDIYPVEEITKTTLLKHKENLFDYSFKTPVILIFNRHAGCTFCRETLQFIKDNRKDIEQDGEIILVHQSDPKDWQEILNAFAIEDISSISDPELVLYKSFGLRKGTLLQVFGPKVWVRGFQLFLKTNLGVGPLEGDGFQMHGAVLFQNGKIMKSSKCVSAADQINFKELGIVV